MRSFSAEVSAAGWPPHGDPDPRFQYEQGVARAGSAPNEIYDSLFVEREAGQRAGKEGRDGRRHRGPGRTTRRRAGKAGGEVNHMPCSLKAKACDFVPQTRPPRKATRLALSLLFTRVRNLGMRRLAQSQHQQEDE